MRTAYLDNAKAILIVLVVVGHAVGGLMKKSELVSVFYWSIYFFHMPLFVAISGYCSKADSTAQDRAKLIERLVIPYLLLQVTYQAAEHYVLGKPKSLSVNLVAPYYTLWYLLALAVWRAVHPYWIQLRWPLIAAVAVGLASGMYGKIGHVGSASRIAVFLPFFVAGALFRERRTLSPSEPKATPLRSWMDGAFQRWRYLLGGVGLLVVVLLAVHAQTAGYDRRWLTAAHSYARLEVDWQTGLLWRGAHYVVAGFASVVVLLLVPRRRTFFTWLGERSLVPYVTHGFLLKLARFQGTSDLWTNDWHSLLHIAAAVALTFALASSPVCKLVQGFLSLGGLTSLLFAPRATQRSSPALAASAVSPSIPTPVPKEERSRVL